MAGTSAAQLGRASAESPSAREAVVVLLIGGPTLSGLINHPELRRRRVDGNEQRSGHVRHRDHRLHQTPAGATRNIRSSLSNETLDFGSGEFDERSMGSAGRAGELA